MGPDRLSTRLFLSFAVFSLSMLSFIILFSWMSYEAGREAASQKMLGAAVESWLSDPTTPLPQGKLLYGVTGVENLPPMSGKLWMNLRRRTMMCPSGSGMKSNCGKASIP